MDNLGIQMKILDIQSHTRQNCVRVEPSSYLQYIQNFIFSVQTLNDFFFFFFYIRCPFKNKCCLLVCEQQFLFLTFNVLILIMITLLSFFLPFGIIIICLWQQNSNNTVIFPLGMHMYPFVSLQLRVEDLSSHCASFVGQDFVVRTGNRYPFKRVNSNELDKSFIIIKDNIVPTSNILFQFIMFNLLSRSK